jgi:hypothetical protein
MSDTILRTQDGKIVDNANPLAVKTSSSDIIQPVDIQSRLQTTIRTHNAVSVAANSTSASAFIDCIGYDKIALSLSNDASTSSLAHIYWSHDGVNNQGYEPNVIASDTLSVKSGETTVKARYARVYIHNADTVAHTMSAWAYLRT